MGYVLTQAFLSYKGLFLWLNWQGYTFQVLVRPSLMLAMYVLAGRFAGAVDADTYMSGLIAYAVPAVLFGGIFQAFYYERAFGTLSFVFVAPGSRLIVYLTKGFLHYPNAVLSALVVMLTAPFLVDMDLGSTSWPTTILSLLLMSASCTTFAMFIGNLTIIFRNWIYFLGSVSGAALGLTGMIIPRHELPWLLGELGALMPITHSLVAFRAGFAGDELRSVLDHLGLELLVGAAYLVVGATMYRLIELEAKRRGIREDL